MRFLKRIEKLYGTFLLFILLFSMNERRVDLTITMHYLVLALLMEKSAMVSLASLRLELFAG